MASTSFLQVRRYSDTYYADVRDWLHDRGMDTIDADDLPMNGLVVPDVAAGFLISTDANVAILDFFISNKSASAIIRGKALNVIIDGLIEIASEMGFKYIKCDSNIRGIKNKALSLGFISTGNYNSFIRRA